MNAALDLFTDTPQGEGTTGTSFEGLKRPITCQSQQGLAKVVTGIRADHPEHAGGLRADGVPPPYTPREALIDTSRRAGVREPDHEDTGGAAPALSLQTCENCARWTDGVGGFGRCDLLPAWRRMNGLSTCTLLPALWQAIDAQVVARREAQRGIDQAAEAAERHTPGWQDRALTFVREYAAANQGRFYIGHDIVQASKVTPLPQPMNDKAWGKVIQRAARLGVIVKDGFAEDQNRHGNPVPRWKSGEAA